MKATNKFYMAIASLLLFTAGCGGQGSSFSLLEEEDFFKQTSGIANTKIDILWVIDNSGSMANSQANLVANLNSFMEDLSVKVWISKWLWPALTLF